MSITHGGRTCTKYMMGREGGQPLPEARIQTEHACLSLFTAFINRIELYINTIQYNYWPVRISAHGIGSSPTR